VLQGERRGTHRIQVLGPGQPRLAADGALDRQSGFLGLLDPGGLLDHSSLREPHSQLGEVAAASEIGGHLAHCDNRRGSPHDVAALDRLSVGIDDEPPLRVARPERDQVEATSPLRFGGQHSRNFALLRDPKRDALELVGQRIAWCVHRVKPMDAPELFAPLGPSYDRWGAVLSFGQDPRWRRFLVSCVDARPTDTVLDVATGTAAVALELVRQKDCFVLGVDRTPEMLAEGRRRVVLAAASQKVKLVEGDARSLPFDDGTFDAVTFTYLLRYVDDPAATLAELARVVKPTGTVASLEFGVPAKPWRSFWDAWTRIGLPTAGRLIGGGWYEVGTFLHPSITAFDERWPLDRLEAAWREAGISGVRTRRMSFGAGVVTWGRRGR
jgi:demethylmenaquinone methyltransferase / 2-methoxy-6-polyprenyl-1,4-benzoquinol methylase